MRKITQEIVRAFQEGRPLHLDNTMTDGQSIFLFGNKIVQRRHNNLTFQDEIWVSLGGQPYSRTTQERLKPFCQVHTAKGKVYLAGSEWDGRWVRLEDHPAAFFPKS